MSKNQKPIPAWAIKAAEELDCCAWIYRDEPSTNPLPVKDVKEVARIIFDAYENRDKK